MGVQRQDKKVIISGITPDSLTVCMRPLNLLFSLGQVCLPQPAALGAVLAAPAPASSSSPHQPSALAADSCSPPQSNKVLAAPTAQPAHEGASSLRSRVERAERGHSWRVSKKAQLHNQMLTYRDAPHVRGAS